MWCIIVLWSDFCCNWWIIFNGLECFWMIDLGIMLCNSLEFISFVLRVYLYGDGLCLCIVGLGNLRIY